MEEFWKGDSDLTGIRQKSAVQWAGVGMEEMSEEEAIGSVVLLGWVFFWLGVVSLINGVILDNG